MEKMKAIQVHAKGEPMTLVEMTFLNRAIIK